MDSKEFEEYKKWVENIESKYADYAFKSIEIEFLDGTSFENCYSNIFNSNDEFDKDRNRYRTPLQVERDRIIHSSLFQRLAHKTQLFTSEKTSLTENRLTHTLKVSQVARSIARGLQLNEDLVEVIALGHDIGHPPFAHIGEIALQEWIGKKIGKKKRESAKYLFPEESPKPAVKVVDIKSELRNDAESYFTFGNDPDEKLFMHGRQGFRLLCYKRKIDRREFLRFSKVVMYGIWRHSAKNFETDGSFEYVKKIQLSGNEKEIRLTGKENLTLEAQVIRYADDISWIISDLEEAIYNGILKAEYVREIFENTVNNSTLGDKLKGTLDSKRINVSELYNIFISDIIKNSSEELKVNKRKAKIKFSDDIATLIEELRKVIQEKLHNAYYVARGSLVNKARIDALCEWYFQNSKEFIEDMENMKKDPQFPIQIPLIKEKGEYLNDNEIYKDLIKGNEVCRVATIADFVGCLTDEEIYKLSETMPIHESL